MNYPHHIEIPMEKVKELSSTNDYLAQLCKDNKAKEFYIVVAENQKQGKGQSLPQHGKFRSEACARHDMVSCRRRPVFLPFTLVDCAAYIPAYDSGI